jgi:hypothetical protein
LLFQFAKAMVKALGIIGRWLVPDFGIPKTTGKSTSVHMMPYLVYCTSRATPPAMAEGEN